MSEDEKYYLTTRENLIREAAAGVSEELRLDEKRNLAGARVLDLGCGVGQALLPLAAQKGALGVGVDISPLPLRMGREFYAEHVPEANITFMNAQAESLPFPSESFDVVNCGLALPYTRNARALSEVARVLRHDGIFMLKIHHALFYLRELLVGMIKADLPSIIHGGRVLTAGTIYHLRRKQPKVKYFNETFQTRWLLSRELAANGMVIEKEDSVCDPATPTYIIRKAAA